MSEISDFHRGDTKKYKFTFSASGSPVDITNWELWFTLKSDLELDDGDAETQVITVAGDDGEDDPVNGVIHITASSEDTEILPGTYHYDFQRVISGSPPNVRTIIKGKVKVLEDVTRRNTP